MREVDYIASVTFLSKIFALSEDLVELRAIPNDGGGVKARAFIGQGGAADLLRFCQLHDIPGVAVYFGCSTRKPGSRQGRKEDLSELVCCWVDVDCYKLGLSVDEVVAALNACACPPSFIVSSGGGVHAYWFLREALAAQPSMEEHELVLKRLCAVFCGDPLPAQAAAVMRLVGTHNSKADGWRECVVLEESGRLYELSDLAEMLDGLPVQLVAAGGPAAPAAGADPFLDFSAIMKMDIEGELAAMKLHHPNAAKGVHSVRLRAAGSLVARGHEDEAIFERLIAETERAVLEGGEAWTERRARDEAKLLRDEIRGAHGKGWAPKADASRGDATKVVQLRPGQSERPEAAAKADPAPEFLGYPLNDLGNALRLLKQHASVMRYVLNIGWHIWDKRRFAYDQESIAARNLAHQTVKDILTQAFGSKAVTAKDRAAIIKFALQCGNSGRLANMLHEAEPHIAHPADALDADPWLLNCRNGTVDLRSGDLRAHAQADLITKIAGTRYEREAACPKWEKFLLEIFGGDAAKTDEDNKVALETVGFLQRSIGYSLTGMTTEQVLFIMYGTGANGKSVLIETISAVMGEYVRHSPAETWVSKPAGASTNDIAALVGARFVSVIETEQDRHLAEALVKQATGGDMITARFHYKEFFSYVPQFKLWFATNHRPKIRGSDYAIWRRIMLLPFTVKFVDGKVGEGQKARDPNLKKDLRSEHPGILAWMVRGCLEWQRIGLQPPALVKDAVESYQNREDNVSGFLRDCCGFSHGLTCGSGLLYTGYQAWCEEEGEEAMPKRGFLRNLDDRGFPAGKRTEKERLRKGLDLNDEYREKAGNWVPPADPAEGGK